MPAKTFVGVERNAAEQRRQFTGRTSANEVHLEEPVLAVGKTGRVGDICAVACRDRRNAIGIAFDRRHGRETHDRNLTIQCWQAAAQA